MQQRIAAASLPDGTEIAYALAGEGPFLVYALGWLTHLEYSWAMPPERAFYEALARGRTLLRYDKPGCGLSGSSGQPPSMEQELQALQAVTRAAGAEHFDLLGTSMGAAVAATWAAAHPQTVRRLVLYGGWVRGQQISAPDAREHVLALVERHWGLGSDVLGEIFAPGADAATRAAFIRYQREAAPPRTARDLLALSYQLDVSEILPRIQAPALVIHRDKDRAAPLAQGQLLAEMIPGARFELLPGRAHLPYIGDADALARSIRAFLGLPALRRSAAPVLTPRQREVAALIAQGLTNREIASRLYITERSAESHAERIRDRLGFRSRAQIAAWFVATSPPS
ncbi:MAG TPA: alpha/beta fold hydrolase [Streptosporangiaceae bacterium]|jgi:pimeloyl-ACP methyl ester carboxylesterase